LCDLSPLHPQGVGVQGEMALAVGLLYDLVAMPLAAVTVAGVLYTPTAAGGVAALALCVQLG